MGCRVSAQIPVERPKTCFSLPRLFVCLFVCFCLFSFLSFCKIDLEHTHFDLMMRFVVQSGHFCCHFFLGGGVVDLLAFS